MQITEQDEILLKLQPESHKTFHCMNCHADRKESERVSYVVLNHGRPTRVTRCKWCAKK